MFKRVANLGSLLHLLETFCRSALKSGVRGQKRNSEKCIFPGHGFSVCNSGFLAKLKTCLKGSRLDSGKRFQEEGRNYLLLPYVIIVSHTE